MLLKPNRLASPLLGAFDPQIQPFAVLNEDIQPNTSFYSRMFDRLTPQPANSQYPLDYKDKGAMFRRGLLGFAAAVTRPNGGNFANALANGLLTGSQTMSDGADKLREDAYKQELMRYKLGGGDTPSGYRQFELMAEAAGLKPGTDEYRRAAQVGLGVSGRAPSAAMKFTTVKGADGLTRIMRQDPMTHEVSVFDEQTQQFLPVGQNGEQVASIAPPKSPQLLQDYGPAETDNYVHSILGKAGNLDWNAPPEQLAGQLLPHLVAQESGGNPNAVSPKGAFGLTQAMPATARDPGFGVRPMQSNTPDEQLRFGRDYLTAMLKRYPGRPDLALAAYNSGPGNADKRVAGLVTGRSPEAEAAAKAAAEAGVQLQTAGDIARAKAYGESQGKTQGDLETSMAKRAQNATNTLELLNRAEGLLKTPGATGSYFGSLYDAGMGAMGRATPGAQATAGLKAIAGQLTANVPRMEGPQSDKDVQLYREMAGNLADDSLPVQTRLAALQTIRSLQQKYANRQPMQGAAPSAPGAPRRLKFNPATGKLE